MVADDRRMAYRPTVLQAAAASSLRTMLEERDIEALVRPKGSPFTVSDIPLLDEAMELLGPDPKAVARQKALDAKRAEEEQFAQDTLAQAGIGSGIVTSQMLVDNINGMDAELTAQRAAADREWTYGHIVVDEAQELTAMDWRMLIRRCPSRSFTIVGDVAQTSALGGTRSWRRMMDPLFGPHNWQLNELTINYRNPKEVSQLACDFAATEGLYISTVNAVRGVPDSVKRLTLADDSLIADAWHSRPSIWSAHSSPPMAPDAWPSSHLTIWSSRCAGGCTNSFAKH